MSGRPSLHRGPVRPSPILRSCTRNRRNSRLQSRKKGSSGKRPKRLVNVSPRGCVNVAIKDTRNNNSVLISPEIFRSGSKSPISLLTPPPFNLSFGSELNDEVLMYMETIDGNVAISSTPLSTSSLSHKCVTFSQPHEFPGNNVSGAPLFDSSNMSEHKELTHLSTPAAMSRSFMQTPAKNAKNHLRLTAWGLPEKVLSQYKKRGITSMFEWQAECLMLPNVLCGGNLVFSAPTSAGKTLIAELLALKCVLESKKQVLIILPFVSIAHEKTNYLQSIFEPVGVKVGGFMGSHAPSGGFASVDIAICTIEKANSLVNRLLEENATNRLGAVIVDELHMIGDSHRGYLLELLLTKLMYVCRRGKATCRNVEVETNASKLPEPESHDTAEAAYVNAIQLIGMSATLPNLDALAGWLCAELYHTDFRPVPLKEMVKVGSTLFDTEFQKIRELEKVEGASEDESDVISLCKETVLYGHSVLIFCPTKNWCESLAVAVASADFLHSSPQSEEGTSSLAKLNRIALFDVCEQLRRTQVGLDQVFGRTIPHGVAFHHAGLTFDEREIIEGAFRRGVLKILVATSTLSAGVNLPARMVIVRTPFFQRALLEVQVYKQMVGRAGRKGEDSEGESVLICKASEKSKVTGLLKSAPRPVESCLGLRKSSDKAKGEKGNEMSAMRRALLEVVVSNTANTTKDIETYASCTLLFADLRRKTTIGKSPRRKKDPGQSTAELITATLQFLLESEFIGVRNPPLQDEGKTAPRDAGPGDDLEYYPTQLGVATVASALSPEEALVVFAELQKARKAFVLENELHIIYLVTPVYIQNQWPRIDWYKYLCIWERLPPGMKHVADTLGVQESFLARAIQGRIPERTVAQRESIRVHQRFFTCLALHDLVHEIPMVEVARRYGASKGLLQSLQGAAGTFAGMVTIFCARLGWRNLELLLSQFQSRLTFGVERELCDLVRISLLNGFRARVLYNFGFQTLAAVATANPIAIETCLRNAVPFASHKRAQEEGNRHTTWCSKLRKGMSEAEAAANIIQEAQMILSEELKVPLSAWNKMAAAPPSDTGHYQPLTTKISNPTLVSSNPVPSTDRETHVPLDKLTRGQRKSPSEDTASDHGEIKKPRLQVVPAIVTEPADTVAHPGGQDFRDEPTGTDTHVRTGSLADVTNRPPLKGVASGVLESHTALSAIPSGFVPASTLLMKETGEVQLPTRVPQLDVNPENNQKSSPPVPCPPSPHPNVDAHDVSSIQYPLTIPDSMDMSVSFGCQTLAELDILCASVEKEPCAMQQGVHQTRQTEEEEQETDSSVPMGEMDTAPQPVLVHGMKNTDTSMLKEIQLSKTTTHAGHVPEKRDPHLESSRSPSRKGHALRRSPQRPVTGTESSAVPRQPLAGTPPSLRDLSASLCSSQLSQASGVTVINVTGNTVLFDTFLSECLEQKQVSFAVATRNVSAEKGIGSAIVSKTKEGTGIPLSWRNEQVVGVAFCWGEMDVYYISLCQEPHGDAIPLSSRIAAIKSIFFECSLREKTIAYDLKTHSKSLLISCGVVPSGVVMDPCVAAWMLDPDAKEKTIHKMVLQYLPEQPTLSEDEACDDIPLSSLATHATDPQTRASAEAVLASMLMSKLVPLLEAQGLYDSFVKLEMPSLLVLSTIELNGIGFSPDECNKLKDILEERLLELEQEAYTLASRSFSLTSPEDVAQVLFLELKLPSSLDEGGEMAKQQKTLGAHTRRGKKRVQHLSTAKEVLEKIKHLHPLPGLILEWRRISSTVTKTIFPLFKDAIAHAAIQSVRIHPTCQIHTATGRVTVSDPSLQMVPKEYNIGASSSPRSDAPLDPKAECLFSESQVLNACQQPTHLSTLPPPPRPSSVCMRNVFTAFPGGVFLAADYSQLELRILAHVSGDKKLQKFLNQEGDVFKMIAGEWLGVPPTGVTGKQRQEAKQVCYGMVYGIGAKALGKQLEVTDDDAAQFMESFKSKYPTMKAFLSKTVQDCREKGHVTTLLGRKRFLPNIHSSNIHARSQAERQAVNTTIQGSAADLVKTAMVNIDQRLQDTFTTSVLPTTTKTCESDRLAHESSSHTPPSGAYLVLQLHDELLYEVCERDLDKVADIVRHEMENALRLSVRFPVKVQVGPSWGRLKEYRTM